ncbi:MAG TPA: hypothetical protein VIH15_13520, partial [Casimicrobiaceae bacterium]
PLPRVEQRGRTEKAANVVGAKGRLAADAHRDSSVERMRTVASGKRDGLQSVYHAHTDRPGNASARWMHDNRQRLTTIPIRPAIALPRIMTQKRGG